MVVTHSRLLRIVVDHCGLVVAGCGSVAVCSGTNVTSLVPLYLLYRFFKICLHFMW